MVLLIPFTLVCQMFFILCDSFGISGFHSFCFLHSVDRLPFFSLVLSQLFGFDSDNAFFLGNRIEMNINVLLAVDRSTSCGFVKLNPINERIKHGVSQFLAVSVFLDQSCNFDFFFLRHDFTSLLYVISK
mgnify:CR=1 FL=1